MLRSTVKVLQGIFIGAVVLVFSGMLTMVILTKTQVSLDFPGISKTLPHTLMFILSVLLIMLFNKDNFQGYGFNLRARFPWIGIIMISLLLGFLSALIANLLTDSPWVGPTKNFTLLEKIIYVWIWASICEEVLTRGLIQGYLHSLKGKGLKVRNLFISAPVCVGAVFFGLMHMMLLTTGAGVLTVINIVIFGTLLGLIAGFYREKTDSLIPAITVHACFNIGAGLLVYMNGFFRNLI